MATNEKVKKLVQVSSALGEIGVAIIEKKIEVKASKEEISGSLAGLGYSEAYNYLEIMANLEKGSPVFYAEKEKVINNLVAEIIKEYKGGIISLMDRAGQTGLKTVKFIPKKSPLILVLAREQIENGTADFFDAAGPIENF